MADKELIEGPGLKLTADPILPQVTGEVDRTVVAFLADLADSSGAARVGTAGGVPLSAKLVAMDAAIAAGGGGGGTGAPGVSAYVHIRYSNDGGVTFTGSGGTVPGGHIGTYSDSSPTASTSVSSYTWALIRGATGPAGPTGATGPQGPQGTQGIQGPVGTNGLRSYFHVAYANSADGTVGFNQSSGAYIGTYSDTNATDSVSPASYVWRLFQGAQGPAGNNGIPGTPGTNGQTPYLHLKYSNDGGLTFTASGGEAPGSWLGQYVDFTLADSNLPSTYTWSKIQGNDGLGAFNLVVSGSATITAPDAAAKAPGGGSWNTGGVHSQESFPGAAYCFFKANQTNAFMAVGLNDDAPVDNDYINLNLQWFLRDDGQAICAVIGVQSSGLTAYTTQTVFGIVWDGATVRFLKDGVTFYTQSFTSTASMAFDAAFYNGGGGINSIRFGSAGLAGATGAIGPQGSQGVPGTPGVNGLTAYFHIAYANSADGTVGFNQVGGNFIGTYVDYTPTDSTNPASYVWRQFTGSQGPSGTQGIPGVNGANGERSYLHIKYSNDGGTNFTASAGETPGAFLGTLVDFVAADSVIPSAYTWALIQGATGPQGVPGPVGVDGQTPYVHIKFSNDGGATFTASGGETPGAYIGVVTDFNAADPVTPGAYTWALIKGAQGDQGIQGPAGANGLPSYTHVKWSNDNGATFTGNGGEDPGTYIGVYTDSTPSDSTNPAAYTWALVRGSDGAPGNTGPAGTPGASLVVAKAYIQQTSQPASPTGGSFNFSSGILTAPAGYTVTRPAFNPAAATWETQFTFSATTPGATAAGGTWALPTKIDNGAGQSATVGFSAFAGSFRSNPSLSAVAGLTLMSNGEIRSSTNSSGSTVTTTVGNWYSPTTVGIGSQYAVLATESGSPISERSNLNNAVPLGGPIGFSLTQTGYGEKEVVINVSIIKNATGLVEGSGALGINAINEP